jgi:hypothetical protein
LTTFLFWNLQKKPLTDLIVQLAQQHLVDVLIRPTLLDAFDHESLKIIHQIEGTSLLTENGLPNITNFSDHLPLIFKLNL